ncbi:MAG: hypothetical protein AVDCRST_MAG91-3178, partial [uncultured Sphingomonadaceae bacterium]
LVVGAAQQDQPGRGRRGPARREPDREL